MVLIKFIFLSLEQNVSTGLVCGTLMLENLYLISIQRHREQNTIVFLFKCEMQYQVQCIQGLMENSSLNLIL